jgi:hypothetical protein
VLGATPDAFRLVSTVEDRLPPVAVVEIPAHRLLEPGVEGLSGTPTEFLLDLRSVNGVAPVGPGRSGTKVISRRRGPCVEP